MANIKVKDLPNATTWSMNDYLIKDKSDGTATEKTPIAELTGKLQLPIPFDYSLSAADIKTLNSIPIELIPAQGSGKVIQILSAFARLTFGTISFTSTTLSLITPGMFHLAQKENINILTASQDLCQTLIDPALPPLPSQYFDNGNIVMEANADSAVGDSTIRIYGTFRIVSL